MVALFCAAMLVQTANAAGTGECGAGPEEAGAAQGLFTLEGVAYQESDLPEALQQRLYEVRLGYYEQQQQIFDAALIDLELAERAKEANSTREAVTAELFAVEPPGEAMVAGFYEANKARINQPFDAVRDRIAQMLIQRQVQSKQNLFVEQVKKARNFRSNISQPIAPVSDIATAGFPSKGGENAKVTVVEFADYQCPHCKHAAEGMRKLIERFGDDLRFVFMDLPVNPSGISRKVAVGAACADQQDEFWAYHDLAFERQETLSETSPTELAEGVQLDMDAFKSCMDSSFGTDRVASAEAEARKLGLSSTPSIFLNGRKLKVHDFETELGDAIAEAIAGGG